MKRRRSSVRVLSVSSSPGAAAWLLLPAVFLLGGVAGHMTAGIESDQLAGILATYGAGTPEAGMDLPALLSLLGRMLRTLALAGILSFSALGVIGLPLLLAVQGFLAAYAISALVRTWGYPGLAAAALWVGGSNLIQLALLLAIAVPGWVCAWEIAGECRLDRVVPRRYAARCVGFCLAGLALAALYQWIAWNYITPVLWARLS